jgi:hypothetical protein
MDGEAMLEMAEYGEQALLEEFPEMTPFVPSSQPLRSRPF